MSLNWGQLVSQGRAKAQGKPWEPEELEALLVLERERKLTRQEAADYIRNGILTPENYDESLKQNFTPTTLDEAEAITAANLHAQGAKITATKGKHKK